jgi:hypothetical protein
MHSEPSVRYQRQATSGWLDPHDRGNVHLLYLQRQIADLDATLLRLTASVRQPSHAVSPGESPFLLGDD